MSSVSFSSDVTQSDYYKCLAVPSVKQVEIRTELIKLTAHVRKNGRITDINIRLMIQSTDWQFLQMEDLPRHKR